MKKEEILNTYNIEKFSFVEIFKDTIEKIKLHNKKLFFLFILYFIYFLVQDYIIVNVGPGFTILLSLIFLLVSLFISAYLMFTFKELDNNILDNDRLIRSLSTIKPQLKTVLSGMVIFLPAIIIFTAIGVAFVLFSSVSTDNPQFLENMQSYYYIGVVAILLILVLLSSIYYATYVTIIHGIEGFTALKFSMLLFKKNLLSSMVFFFIMAILPFIISMVQEFLYKDAVIFFTFLVVQSLISIFSIFFLSKLLDKTKLVQNPLIGF